MNKDKKISRSIAILTLITGGILLIPLVSMYFTDEVNWTLSDFILMGILIFGTGLTYLSITRTSEDIAYRISTGFALFTGLLLIWVNLAVGIIGSENNAINLLYFGVIAVGIIGALFARFESNKMVYVMFTMALTQALVAIAALITGMQKVPGSSVIEILAVNGFFMMLFLISGLMFRYAAKGTEEFSANQIK